MKRSNYNPWVRYEITNDDEYYGAINDVIDSLQRMLDLPPEYTNYVAVDRLIEGLKDIRNYIRDL